MLALIDGDVITYSVGFASDIRIYEVDNLFFQTKKEAKKYCDDKSIDYDEIFLRTQPEELSHCLHSVKKMIQAVMQDAEADEQQIYLTGDGNFRDDVAVTLPYKGNRDSGHKPYWYTEIREYLVDKWSATIINGAEADDAMASMQYQDYQTACVAEGPRGPMLGANTIICTIDKDLDMIPGWHYNWKKKEKYWVTPEDADYFFWKQMLTGDMTDNIKGIPGIGPKKAEKALSLGTTHDDYFEIVKDMYEVAYGDNHVDVMKEMSQLLWIVREPNKLNPIERYVANES